MADNYAYFYNDKDGDREYDAESMTDWLRPFFVTGVFNGGLRVVANDNMSVTVETGYCNIDGKVKNFFKKTSLDLETASGTLDRIDTVILRRNDTERDIQIIIQTGGYSSNPTPVPLVRSGAYYDLKLAEIYIAAGTIRITQAEITDTRADKDVCGWVCATVKEIDFSQIKAQFDKFFANYEADIRTQYSLYLNDIGSLETQAQDRYDSMDREFTDYENQQKENITQWQQDEKEYLDAWISAVQTEYFAWLDRLKEILDENAAGHLQNEVDDLTVDAFNRYYGLQAQETLFQEDGSIKTINEEAEIITEFGFDCDGNETAVTTVKPKTGMYDYVKTTIFFAERVASSTEKKERV